MSTDNSIQQGELDRLFLTHFADQEEQSNFSSDKVIQVATVTFSDEHKPSPADDSTYWRGRCRELEQSSQRAVFEANSTTSYFRLQLEKKEAEIERLRLENTQLNALLKPYVNQILENITKGVIREIAKNPELLRKLKEYMGEKRGVTAKEVMQTLEKLLEEEQIAEIKLSSDEVELTSDQVALEKEVLELKRVIGLLNLKKGDLDVQIPVEKLPLTNTATSSNSHGSYLSMAGTGAKVLGHVLWNGTKMSGKFSWWLCNNLIPILTFGMVSAVVLESPWTPVLMWVLGLL